MSRLISLARKYLEEETGATAIEYALIATLTTVAAMVALYALSTAISDMFTNVTETVTDAGT
jgi:pilus assembly protein Flp/PilA